LCECSFCCLSLEMNVKSIAILWDASLSREAVDKVSEFFSFTLFLFVNENCWLLLFQHMSITSQSLTLFDCWSDTRISNFGGCFGVFTKRCLYWSLCLSQYMWFQTNIQSTHRIVSNNIEKHENSVSEAFIWVVECIKKWFIEGYQDNSIRWRHPLWLFRFSQQRKSWERLHSVLYGWTCFNRYISIALTQMNFLDKNTLWTLIVCLKILIKLNWIE
jgi:hypothetical protein